MYVGQGLGIVDYTATGVRFRDQPSCLFADERAAAEQQCWAGATIRGLGGTTMPSGRLAGLDACDLKNLPLCPSTPSCMDIETAALIGGCISGSYTHDEHRTWCESYYGPLYYANSPLCGGAHLFPPVPACLDDNLVAGRAYCKDYGFTGPDPGMNALCWLAQKDLGWWHDLQAAPTCRSLEPPPAIPPIMPPPPTYEPPAPPPQPPPVPTLPDPVLPPSEPYHEESRMIGVGSILLLLAAAGGGYYAYRRYRGRA
jgi:hypothetical protein